METSFIVNAIYFRKDCPLTFLKCLEITAHVIVLTCSLTLDIALYKNNE